LKLKLWLNIYIFGCVLHRTLAVCCHNGALNSDKRIMTDTDKERLKNCRKELLLETVELLDVNELCGDDSDDSW